MDRPDWTTTAGLLALMELPRVGPATALAVGRGERDAAGLRDADGLVELREQAAEQIDALLRDGIVVLGFFDARFPSRLRAMPAPPAVVYVRGDLAAFDGSALAVVGTREPTSFGVTSTQQLTRAAAERGVTIVSGLALGVDALAHQAALDADDRTIAVLGSGVDQVPLRQQLELAQRIVDSGGALLSEQPPGTPPSARRLVARNRLQAALADGLLVSQTGIKGGTMHTVRFAAEQGRPIWCPVPAAPSEKTAGLIALLQTPASALPSLLPAWEGHERLAARLGPSPLARPAMPEAISSWLERLAAPTVGAASPVGPPGSPVDDSRPAGSASERPDGRFPIGPRVTHPRAG